MHEKRQKLLIALGESFAGTEVIHKPEWEAWVFSVCNKIFAYIGTDNQNRPIITLKAKSEDNLFLRESFQAISPGYYANKTHWSSVDLQSDEIADELINELLENSYKLVVHKLPKKTQQQLSV